MSFGSSSGFKPPFLDIGTLNTASLIRERKHQEDDIYPSRDSFLSRSFRLLLDAPCAAVGFQGAQFASRLEYLRFCQRYALHDRRCD
jgi:hypothetical protein